MNTTFHGLDFVTAPGRVFTPRATTEALVDEALELIGDRKVRVGDIGTGTGAIGVAIAVAAPQTQVWGTDINPEAVRLARLNAERHGVSDRFHVVAGNLLEPIPEPLDIVVANLPYLPRASRDAPEHVDLAGEPEDAVYAPDDGLGPLHGLLSLCAAGKLVMPGFVVVQFHGEVLEADCQHLEELREQLELEARAAA